MSLLIDCLQKNEGVDLQAVYVGRLDQSEAEKEAGGQMSGKGD